jgi:plasmid stabilization system protein ParE
MLRAVSFEPAATRDVASAAAWYDLRRPGFGPDFVREVDRVVRLLAEMPEAGTRSPRGRFRSFPVSRFPFVVHYRVEEDVVRVYAVANTRRRPGYWRRRH